MTREERIEFVIATFFGDFTTAADAAVKIVDRWEEDVDAAFTRGIYAEQER